MPLRLPGRFRLITRRSALIDPIRRGVAFGVALSLHFVFWILALYFTGHGPSRPARHRGIENPLQLMLLAPSATPQVPRETSATDATAARARGAAARPSHRMPVALVPTPTVAEQTASPASRHSGPSATITDDYVDGGFSARLKARQGSRAAPRLPGSSVPLVPGIKLIDRDEQGTGALVRKTKRLFGMTDRHCVDVDVWQHLASRELSERHISPSDVDRTSDAHHCNRPLGLSF